MLLRLLAIIIFRLRELYISPPKRVYIRIGRSNRLVIYVSNLEISVEGINPTIGFSGRVRFRAIKIF